MNNLVIFILLLTIVIIHSGCNKEDTGPNRNSNTQDSWLVNSSDVLYQGSEKDRIQSIDSPLFIPIHSVNLNEDELVYSVNYNGTTKVYPLSVLGAHEIVNDKIDNFYYAVTYCPLTGSGIAWDRKINGKITEFGVSGMLYKDNLIPYDRNSLSNWSQMKGLCINGKLIGYEAEQIPLISSTFGMIKNSYPDALIIDHEKCGEDICRNVRSGNDFGEPGDFTELPPGKQYFGVTKDQSLLLFDFELFIDSIQIYHVSFKSRKLLIVGNDKNQYFSAFSYNGNFLENSLFPVQNNLPVVMRDHEGNTYDLFGNIVSGPNAGIRLSSSNAYYAYSFAWQTIFNDIEIYSE